MSSDILGLVAVGGGGLVLTTARGFNPAVPAIAAPIAVAWPHGAPALGAGVAAGALTLAQPRRVPGPAMLFAIALAILVAVRGDGALVRSASAAVAIAVVTPAFVRSIEDLLLAGVALGLASAGLAFGAGIAGVSGARADLFSVGAAIGLAAAAGAAAPAIAAMDLAGVIALPSRAGLVAAAVAVAGLLIVRRLTSIDAIIATAAVALAWIAGAPLSRAPWRNLSAFEDSYHRLGAGGVALFALLLLATALGLPRPLTPGLAAAAVGAIFVPLEAAAPVWLLAGLAAASSSPEGPLRATFEEQRLLRRELELEVERQTLAEEQRRLRARRQALDEREAALERRELEKPAPTPPPPPSLLPPAAPEPESEPDPVAVEPPAEPEPKPEPEPEPVAPPEPPEPKELEPRWGEYDIAALRALVRVRAGEFPDRVDEWEIYLEMLEPYAVQGILPFEFGGTVAEVFEPILGSAPSV